MDEDMDRGTFRTTITVRFGDCDPAGIVFYPRYFEMFNNLVEDWCEQGLGTSFAQLVREQGLGLPTIRFETDFAAPSELGERLQANLQVESLGQSSIVLDVTIKGPDGGLRVRSRQVLVLINRRTGRKINIPAHLREQMARFQAPGFKA